MGGEADRRDNARQREGPDARRSQALVRRLLRPWSPRSDDDAFLVRVVTGLFLINLLAALTATVSFLLVEREGGARVTLLFFGVSAINGALYALSRTRHFRLAVWLLVLNCMLGILLAGLTLPRIESVIVACCWLVVGIGISSFVLPVRHSLLIILLSLGVPPVLAAVRSFPIGTLIALQLFILTTSLVLVFHRWVTRRAQRLAERRLRAQHEEERARHEADALRSGQEAELQSTLDSISDAVIAVDGDGSVERLNPAAEALVGQSADEALGQPVDALLPLRNPHTGETTSALTPDEDRGGYQATTCTLLLHADEGTERTLEISSAPQLDATGADAGAVLVIRDKSARRVLEEQLQQAQRLEAVGQLAGGVAHDFNNLLFTVSATTELMEMTAESDFPFRNELRDILEAVERGSSLTGQLLAFSRQQVLRKEPVDLGEVIKQLTKMLRRIIGEDIELELELDPDLHPVFADRRQMEQILINLAVNSRDAMARGGTLRFTTANVQVTTDIDAATGSLPAGDYVLLSIHDSGEGMPEEVLEHIFEPFFTTKASERGTGLGLSVAYGIVQQHDGALTAISSPGTGTEFRMVLPRHVVHTAEEPAPHRAPPPAPGAGETILFVEDEEMPRRLTARALTKLGYRVVTGVDGRHGLEVAAEHEGPIDLLLTDVLMPNMSGPEMYRHLLEQRPNLPVIYLSGYTDEAIARQGVMEEGVLLLPKPVSLRKLAATLRSLFDSGPANA